MKFHLCLLLNLKNKIKKRIMSIKSTKIIFFKVFLEFPHLIKKNCSIMVLAKKVILFSSQWCSSFEH